MTCSTAAASLIAAALLTLPACTSSRAQNTDSSTMPVAPASGPAIPTADEPNAQDRTFVHLAGVGGLAEVEMGELAQQKASSDRVRSFARRMVEDHGQANDKLAALAEENDLPMPHGLDDDHRAMHQHLETLSGSQFDITYMRGQAADHQKTAQILEWEINSGQDGEIKSLAADTLPTVLRHLEMAKAILAEISLQAAQ